MQLVMIGTGYVGLVTGTCFAESGNDVICIDIDAGKIQRLQSGEMPIYEPGLAELVLRNQKARRLHFSTDLATAVAKAHCVFIAVGTPQGDDGAASLSAVWAVVDSLAPHLPESAIVVIKSTVPVGTNRLVAARLRELTGRDVDVASNPEFLKEGCAIQDFTKPDRVVVGVEREQVASILHDLYKPFLRTENPFLTMGLESAEMTKYVANCFLATKISFINEMANLCESVGADINEVRRGIGHDARIGFSFLFPGVGYGGSCFPKDVRALTSVAIAHGLQPQMLNAVDEVNDRQKRVLFQKIHKYLEGDLSGKVVAIWGLSFKPGTDDIRESPALILIDELLAAGAVVRVHDPVACNNVRARYCDRLTYCEHHYETLDKADVLAICTEWQEFRHPDFDYMKYRMRQPLIIDGRNLYEPAQMRARGFTYLGIGLRT
jgi:UDPglucose 6-dehydrogenase